MVMSRQVTPKNNLKIGGYSFEQVKDFKCFWGVNINEENNVHDEIKLKLSAANKIYYAMKKMFSSKLLSRRTKERLAERPIGRPRQRWLDIEKRDLTQIYHTYSTNLASDRNQ